MGLFVFIPTKGYSDIGQVWKEEMGIYDLENFSDHLYNSVKPLYVLLHAVVRFRLKKNYPTIVNSTGLIPAHLFGDPWSQNWQSLINILLPDSTFHANITENMKKKNYTVIDMVKRSDDFYKSLGFPGMTKNFWKYSIFVWKNSSNGNCHASARNMYVKDDFRIHACLEVNEDDFYLIHHEMGHVQYYMAYQKQPAIFRVLK